MTRVPRRRFATGNHRTPMLTPLAAAVVAALHTVPVAAQETPGEDVEEVVVTGSRIRHDTFSSAAPMEVVTTEQASVRGITDVATLLQSSTAAASGQQVTPAISAASVSPGGLGTSTLSLRGLGANRTLVLLNGRRAGPAGVQGSVSSFDLNVIPLSAVERVEILKDGASSIYGSDAVAGVVNIITRKDEGAQFDVSFSQPHESGGEQLGLNGSWGKRFDRAYFRVTADYKHQSILNRGDRDWFKCDEHYIFDLDTKQRADYIDPRTGEPFCDGTTWGHVWVYDYAETVGDGTTNIAPPVFLLQYDYDGHLAANGVPPIPPAQNPNHMVAPPNWYPVERGDYLTNSLTDSDHPLHDTTTLVPEADVTTLLLEGEYALKDDLTLYSEVLLSRRKTKDEGFRQIWSYLYNYDSADLGWPSDPFSVGWTGAQWLSPLAITDHNDSRVTVDYRRFVAGLRGDHVPFLENWSWDVAIQYSRSDGEYQEDQVLDDSLKMAYWRTGSCVGQVTPISNLPCVDVPWLDPDFHNGIISQEVRDFLFAVETGNTEYTQWSVEAFMTGDVMELPAGSMALAVGVHYQYDELLDVPGEITLARNAWEGSNAGITSGDDTTRAVFAEVNVPLLSDLPLVERLEFTGSARYTDVQSYGSDTTYKVGINWSLSDALRFRSTYGTSFRAPALYELYLAGETSGLSARSADPCMQWGDKLARGEISQRMADNCAADGLPPDLFYTLGADVVTGGGAGLLKAETSDALTVGFVWQPQFSDLSVSIDYFDIQVKDEVDVIGARNIVNGCYESPFFPDDPLCSLFTRNPPDHPLPLFVTEIRDSYINISEQHNRGVDLAVRWVQELGRLGTLTTETQHTYLIEDVLGLFDNTTEDLAGEAGHPEWVGNLNFTLNREAWSFFWGMDFVGETSNLESFGRDTVISALNEEVLIDLEAEFTMYHSLSVSHDFADGWRARLGVANALDERPPRMTAWATGSEVDILGQVAFYSQYDWYGRRYFLNVSRAFE
jgi:iron complex outermembrane receptor protein